MLYKNMSLNRELIKDVIRNYDQDLEIDQDVTSVTIFHEDQHRRLILFHFIKNGKTTIELKESSNIKLNGLGKKIVEEIISQCQIKLPLEGDFVIKLDIEGFNLLIDYLRDECGFEITEQDVKDGRSYSVNGVQGDTAIITYSDNQIFKLKKYSVLLYSKIIDFISEILDLEDVVASQLSLIKVPITTKQVLTDLSIYLPNAYEFLDSKLRATLSPSLAVKKLDIELPDYSLFTFPALKGLEGYIKQLFYSKGIIIGKEGFAPYLRNDTHKTINEDFRKKIGCVKTCKAINQCYNYYKSNRHGLFHTDDVISNTKIIKSRREAISIINSVLHKIETSYSAIKA